MVNYVYSSEEDYMPAKTKKQKLQDYSKKLKQTIKKKVAPKPKVKVKPVPKTKGKRKLGLTIRGKK